MKINDSVDMLRDELIQSVQEVVRVKSVEEEAKLGMPFGEGPANALETALEIARNLGFKVVNLDNYVGYAEYGEGDEYVAVLGHLDVVPEGDGWKYPPYAAEIHDGKIYGRGTTDDKGPIISALFALKAIVDAKVSLSKKVRIIFGTNEESGSKELKYYLDREKPPVSGFTPDAEYPIINGEKGITIFDLVKDLNTKPQRDINIKYIRGGQKANMVPDYCEAGIITDLKSSLIESCENFSERTGYDLKIEEKDNMVKVKSYGVSAHGSLPHLGKNAIMQLFAFLGELDLGTSDILKFINFFNRYVGFEVNGESFGVGLSDDVSGELSFNLGVVEIDENKARLTLNLRYPVTKTYEDLIKPLEERIDGTGIRIENMQHQKPLYFSEDHPLIKTLQKVYSEQTGDEPKLLSIGGGTYAKEMPNIVAFGPIFPGKPDLDHQTNEYIEVEDLILNAKIYAHTIYELAK
ncbi:dipeptidase PepV [Clostridium pasteurianum DSM 525 = ATCC 6013]|uniref:Dipeptidase n=1 Tax=Clostridium pasteurianum DSM 525 = ATCC 6013 TaxID=1262449 RepID=A0A0H3J745_CLOPA|nr:dipeptidase PepV [Clostridium pasteurianum]AJA49294.1 dipeptidase PepV [Clostridium pasteurianum DSM 525 = ATCC 6013]AJA53282.1 dipeptidase PepV [Clostridium pasteurianum DSM 525 = ATCC 6013]AOZ76472.1 diguanylate cyclase [Clostridium pasteurianum DSM 525 = ATCC 6013]AOZ80269.1 diguanylate cyclase [Clostridium pasteurianum]ELP58314.1 dipeptidase PepV [Clostridium pasteurianum DSM 525 = ATCC 6013]